MMKKILTVLAFATLAAACKPTADYKAERDEVMKFHDVVMQDHGKLVDNQMKLDTLMKSLPSLKKQFPAIDTAAEKGRMKETEERLNKAEDQMNTWMHQFEPDVTGKSNAAAILYFKGERKKIAHIDSIYKAEIKLSDTYLSKFKQ